MNHQEVEQMLNSKTQWANCNLAHMEVSDEGVQCLFAALPRRTEVKELCLGHSSITNHGMSEMARDAQTGLLTVITHGRE